MSKSELWHRLTLAGFLTLLAAWSQNTEAFNVDTKYPKVFRGPANSYFGYSVTFGRENRNNWLLVGAPKANQSNLPFLVQPGAIYQCVFSETSSKCTEVKVDDKGNTEGSYYRENYYSLKDRGWLGVSLDTNHDRSLMVACAHRWEDQRDYLIWKSRPNRKKSDISVSRANGMCYTMTPDLHTSNIKEYMPLLSHWNQIDSRGIPIYAFGMAGMAAHFPEHSGELILGAPGVYLWDGNAISVQLDNQNDDPPKTVIWGTRDVGIGTKFAYFGYSVSSGIFTSNDITPWNVIGAPRHKYTGQVFLITELVKNSQIKNKWEGKQMGEYFGSAVCATDLNGDNLADVIIGAPFYSDPQQSGRDHGKVYVILNEDFNMFAEPLELRGSNAPNARFGSAIGCLGDLDLDDRQDIAVGAPYEDDGAGAVYIYYGDKIRGIAEDLVQKLTAKDIDHNLRGFGISFAKSLDVDRNSFSDLGIGSYASDQALILRTRRVIIPNIVLTTTPNAVSVELHPCTYRGIKVRCFNVSFCFSYTTESPSLSFLAFEYQLRVDVDHKGEAARGNIVQANELKQFVSDVIQVKKRSKHCTAFEVYLRNDIRNYVPPIVVSLKSSLQPCSTPTPIQYFESCPVVHPRSRMHVYSEVSLLKGCKNGEICESDLQLQASIVFKNNEVLKPNVTPGVNKTFTINTTITNTGENAYLSELNITLPTKLSLDTLPLGCVEQSSNAQYRYTICDIGNPLTTAALVSMQLIVNLEKVSWFDQVLGIILTVNTASNDRNLNNNRKAFLVPVLTVADIYVVGMQSDQYISYANYSERKEELVNFTHHYHVINLGPGAIPRVGVTIQVPLQSGDNVFLKEARVNTKDGNKGALVTDCRGALARHLKDTGEDRDVIHTPDAVRRRRKREANQSSPTERGTPLFCSENIKCRYITCEVAMMQADDSVVISIVMKVDHKELDNLKFKQEIVDFTTRAEANISNVQPVVHQPDFAKVVTSLDSGRSVAESLADWVIPVSIIAGFLLLMLIALIFYKAGFFQRHQRDNMKQLLQEQEENHPAGAVSQNPLMDDEFLEEQTVQQQSE